MIEVTSLAPPYSDTGSDVWTTPKIVSTPSSTANSFFPWLAVDDVTGAVYVDYYSCINQHAVSNNWETDTYMAYSIDGGSTYNNIRVSDTSHALSSIAAFNPGGTGTPYFEGDYIGLAAYNGVVYPAWMDSRNGTPQVYVAKVTIGPYQINTNTALTGNDSMQMDIEVTPGHTLTIPSGIVVKMGVGRHILVDSNAVLKVSGTLTNYITSCGDSSLWAAS